MTFADLKILMARRYYRRRTVVVRPKKKWASNMQVGSLTTASPTAILAENSVQTSSPTPIIVKVGNIKLQGDAALNMSSATIAGVSFVVVVYYLPEGITLAGTTASNIISQHPEWIMAWRQVDIGTSIGSGVLAGNSFSVSSRLKRNLNSGDRVCVGYITDAANVTVTIKYTAQYWTCAN